jgi:hypothetical protein
MKSLILSLAIAVTVMAACKSGSNKSAEGQINKDSLNNSDNKAAVSSSADTDEMNSSSIKEIVNNYLQLKNALAEDNTSEAAKCGTKLEATFKNFDKTVLDSAQKKTFEDVETDAREHSEHIGANSGNIEHQRAHFKILSKDIYDLVKASGGGGQVLYRVFDSMVNNGKGAFWLSETKEIKNPYMGKAMPTRGTVKEEIK